MTVSVVVRVKRDAPNRRRFKRTAENLGALETFGGEIYVANPRRHGVKVWHMQRLGNDPLDVPKGLANSMRRAMKWAILHGTQKQVQRELKKQAEFVADFLKKRISDGRLGRMKASTIRSKVSAAARGKASRRFGTPGPYGFLTGGFYNAIKVRVGRRSRRRRG